MITIHVQDKLSPAMRKMVDGMHGEGKVRISEAMGGEVRSLVVWHLTSLAASKHTTANKLGATPTGYIANLAENFDQSSTLTFDASGATLAMRHPVISRAVRDVTITPKKQFLTIPLNALAYSRRCGEFQEVQFVHGRSEAVRQDMPAYLLVRGVTQKQDRSLLPGDDELATAAADAAKREVKTLLTEAQRL